ncbi:unnamed protein product [Laminaria digitata]
MAVRIRRYIFLYKSLGTTGTLLLTNKAVSLNKAVIGVSHTTALFGDYYCTENDQPRAVEGNTAQGRSLSVRRRFSEELLDSSAPPHDPVFPTALLSGIMLSLRPLKVRRQHDETSSTYS